MAALGALPTTAIDHHPDLAFTAPAASHSIEYRALPDGDGATFVTLDAMRDAVSGRIPPDFSGYQDEFNIRAAHGICAQTPGHNQRAQIAALFDYVAHKIRYEPHPINEQTLQDCRRTIELGSGDCVSLSVCLATLLACLGHRPYFIAQWLDGESASHVYVGIRLDGEELRLDPVASDQPMGWSQETLDGGFECAWEIF